MPTRDSAPIGSPCWADLWTSDVEGSRTFYSELFGWEAQEPSPEFGGYFMFTRDGVPVAGGMGDMGDMPANNTWKIYLAHRRHRQDRRGGRGRRAPRSSRPAMPVADLGTQAVLVDPTGAAARRLAARDLPGFHRARTSTGAPSWFELHTRDHAAAVAFYRSVFGWDTNAVGDSDEFRYTTMRNPGGEGELAGIMDASASFPRACPPTGRSTGRSTTSTPPWPRSRPSADRW